MREYELTVIANNHQNEEDTLKLFERYEAIFLADGGQIIKKSDWGHKKLTFPIKKSFRGRYMHYAFTGLPASIKEAERLMKIDDNIIRHLTIKVSEGVDIEARKAELVKQEALVKEMNAAKS